MSQTLEEVADRRRRLALHTRKNLSEVVTSDMSHEHNRRIRHTLTLYVELVETFLFILYVEANSQ